MIPSHYSHFIWNCRYKMCGYPKFLMILDIRRSLKLVETFSLIRDWTNPASHGVSPNVLSMWTWIFFSCGHINNNSLQICLDIVYLSSSVCTEGSGRMIPGHYTLLCKRRNWNVHRLKTGTPNPREKRFLGRKFQTPLWVPTPFLTKCIY